MQLGIKQVLRSEGAGTGDYDSDVNLTDYHALIQIDICPNFVHKSKTHKINVGPSKAENEPLSVAKNKHHLNDVFASLAASLKEVASLFAVNLHSHLRSSVRTAMFLPVFPKGSRKAAATLDSIAHLRPCQEQGTRPGQRIWPYRFDEHEESLVALPR